MYRYDKKKRQLAKRYTTVKLSIGIFNGIFVPLAFLALLVVSGWNATIAAFAAGFGILSIPVYAIVFMTLLNAVRFPVKFYSSFIYEHKYKLSNHTLRSWFVDYFKGLFLGYIFFIPVISGLFFVFGASANWWIYATIAYFFLTTAMSYIFPIVIMPFFYKIEPYRNARHKKMLLDRIRSMGLKDVKNVVVVKESEKSKKPNAVFMGIGKTKTIGLFDTLLHDFPRAEVESVIWHELGHYVGRDNIRHILFETFKIGFILWLVNRIFVAYSMQLTLLSFPVFMLLYMLLDILTMPVVNTYSRHLEKRADLFSLDLTRDINVHVSTEMRLADMHLSELTMHRFIEFFFYTHPTVQRRIDYARAHYKKHMKK